MHDLLGAAGNSTDISINVGQTSQVSFILLYLIMP
jgi:hypothetical protein